MNLSKLFRTRSLVTIALILVVSLVIYGFAAANTVPESGAGDGAGDVSGYTITNIEYTLLAADPTKLQVVEFDIDPTANAGSATDVRITVDGSTWLTCTVAADHATCTYANGSEPAVAPISELRVVAVD